MIIFKSFLSIILLLAQSGYAKCILPTPDGGVENVSNRNFAGFLRESHRSSIRISEYQTNRTILIDIRAAKTAYSAFGGDAKTTELTVGLPVRIWLKNCKLKSDGGAVAAYIEFYSNDLNDKPSREYFEASGQ